jgi:hypothetical protein
MLLGIGVLLGLVLYGIARATWRPSAPLRLARRRAWGQVLASAGRMYVGRMRLFVGIGLLLIPVAVLTTAVQALVIWLAGAAGIDVEGEAGGVLVLVVLTIGTTLTLLGLAFVEAVTARALVEIDAGRPVGPIRAYRLGLASTRPLLGAAVVFVTVWVVLTATVFLVPVAIWLAMRWALLAQTAVLEGCFSLEALRRSSRLVRRRWLKVASLVGVGAALAIVAGPLVGALLILLTDAPLALLNIVASIVYALAMPFVALTTSYVYFDARAREALEPGHEPDELPAEIALSA